jgi:hypothetical protein
MINRSSQIKGNLSQPWTSKQEKQAGEDAGYHVNLLGTPKWA